MQHDTYSPEVYLLEIGLWGTFVDYNAGSLSLISNNGNPTSVDQFDPLTVDTSFFEDTQFPLC
jgi:hypothetical protein